MRQKFVIKLSSRSSKVLNKENKKIVVGLNNTKSNGPYIEKLGYKARATQHDIICNVKTKELGLWLNKGAILKSKVSWILGLLSYAERERLKKNEIKLKL